MNKIPLAAALAGILGLAPFTSQADQLKVKASVLSQQDATSLRGKRVAVARHSSKSFVDWLILPFGINPIKRAYDSGNRFVAENEIPDPTLLARDVLAKTLAEQFGASVLQEDGSIIASEKGADLVSVNHDSDFILSVSHGGSAMAASPGGVMIGNHVHVQLIETSSARVISKGRCYASTYKHPSSPSQEALRENDAQLTKAILTSLAWRCARQYAIEGFGLPADRAPAIPQEHLDPLEGRPITTVMGARRAAREKRAGNVDGKAEQNAPPQD